MTVKKKAVVDSLNHEFLSRHPGRALQLLNSLPSSQLLPLLAEQAPQLMLQLWEGLMIDNATTRFDMGCIW